MILFQQRNGVLKITLRNGKKVYLSLELGRNGNLFLIVWQFDRLFETVQDLLHIICLVQPTHDQIISMYEV